MQLLRSKTALMLMALTSVFLMVTQLWALEPGKDGFYFTGSAIRVKTVAFIDVNVYEVSHFMKQLPPTKSKQAVIEADVDKRISMKMLRDVDADKIKSAFKDAFAMNGYGDSGKINQFIGTFTNELKENSRTAIIYDAASKTTTITAANGGTAKIAGVDFMKAVWSIWLGKIDQPKLGDSLIKNI